MKTSNLKRYFQCFISNIITKNEENDSVELGFEAMLNHDAVEFLIANQNRIKPLARHAPLQQ